MIGLTSITFRGLTPLEIIDLTVKAGLEGIEWGSDIHVHPGQKKLAEEVAAACAEAGLVVTSYGSYFKAGQVEDPSEEIEALLVSAKALGAPVIRVWAGEQGPLTANAGYRKRVETSLRMFVERAAEEGICVAAEYHRRTLTENADSALQLLEAVPGLMTYWQPNPDISEAENLEELGKILPYLLNIHVFQWTAPGNIRHPLAEGRDIWQQYIRRVQDGTAAEHHYLLEFVQDDRLEQCIEDAHVLQAMVKGI